MACPVQTRLKIVARAGNRGQPGLQGLADGGRGSPSGIEGGQPHAAGEIEMTPPGLPAVRSRRYRREKGGHADVARDVEKSQVQLRPCDRRGLTRDFVRPQRLGIDAGVRDLLVRSQMPELAGVPFDALGQAVQHGLDHEVARPKTVARLPVGPIRVRRIDLDGLGRNPDDVNPS